MLAEGAVKVRVPPPIFVSDRLAGVVEVNAPENVVELSSNPTLKTVTAADELVTVPAPAKVPVKEPITVAWLLTSKVLPGATVTAVLNGRALATPIFRVLPLVPFRYVPPV